MNNVVQCERAITQADTAAAFGEEKKLYDANKEVQALEQCIRETRQSKQDMIQKLLTGRTRFLRGKSDG